MKYLELDSIGSVSLKLRQFKTPGSKRKKESHSPIGIAGCTFGHAQPLKVMPGLNLPRGQSDLSSGV